MLVLLGSLLLVLWVLSLLSLNAGLVPFLLALGISFFVLHGVTKRMRPA